MIAKIPPRVVGGRGFEGLVAYIERADKASNVLLGGVSSLETAVLEMKAVAEMNPSVKDAVYHVILSWPKFERPNEAQVKDAVKSQLTALGYGDHQYVAAVHNDSDNLHVHIAINRVNPKTFRGHSPRGDFFILDRTCREIELRQGWTNDRGPHCVEWVGEQSFIIAARDRRLLRQLSDGAKKIERYTADMSFERYVRDSEPLSEIFTKARSWQQIHDMLRLYGLEIANPDNTHNGYVLRNKENTQHARASLIYGYSHKDIKTKFGAFKADTRETENEIATILCDMTRFQSVFSDRDIDGYLNAFVDEHRRDTVKRALVENQNTIHLVADANGVARYTSLDVRNEELLALATAQNFASKPGIETVPAAVDATVAAAKMRPDQMNVFRRVVSSQRLSVVRGRAGTGKSFAVGEIRKAYEAGGTTVIGLGPTHEVISAQIKDGFRSAMTVDAVISALEKKTINFDENTVLVVDECGMVSNDKILKLLQLTCNVGKLVLVGDDRQLPSIERGGLFAELAVRHDAGSITTVVRQKETRQKEAAQHFSMGEFEDGLHILHQDERIKWNGTDDESKDALLEQWKSDYKSNKAETRFVLSYRNSDVDYFNRKIHDHLVAIGEVTNERMVSTRHGKFAFGVNDKIQFSATDKRLRITNGMRGTITSLTDKVMQVKTDGGETISIPIGKEHGFDAIRHCFCGSVYKSQGASISRVYLHHTSDWRDASGYVAMSRQTESAVIFASKETASDWRDIARQLKRTMMKAASVSIENAAVRHTVRPVEGTMTTEATKIVSQLTLEKAAKPNIVPPTPSQPNNLVTKDCWQKRELTSKASLKAKLYNRYKESLTKINSYNNTGWFTELVNAKKARDTEIAKIRADYELAKVFIRERSVPILENVMMFVRNEELQDAVISARQRHRRAIKEIASKRPKQTSFDDWVTKSSNDGNYEARMYMQWRKTAHDRHSNHHISHLVDLCQILKDADWHLTEHLPNSSQLWSDSRNVNSVIVQTDKDGSGVRWFQESTREGSSIMALLNLLYEDHRKREALYESYLDDAETLTRYNIEQESDRFDHRTYDVILARSDFDSGRVVDANKAQKIGNTNVHKVLKMLGSRESDVRIVSRPGGNALLIANRDTKNNIVGFELISAHYRTVVRGSARGSAYAIDMLKELEYKSRKTEETPDIAKCINILVSLKYTKMINLSEKTCKEQLDMAAIGCAFLGRHPETQSKIEKIAYKNLNGICTSLEQHWQHAAKAQRKELEDDAVLSAKTVLEKTDLTDDRLKTMAPVERFNIITAVISALKTFEQFIQLIPFRVRHQNELELIERIKLEIYDIKTRWLDIVSDQKQLSAFNYVRNYIKSSSMLNGAPEGICESARACAMSMWYNPFNPNHPDAYRVINLIDAYIKPNGGDGVNQKKEVTRIQTYDSDPKPP